MSTQLQSEIRIHRNLRHQHVVRFDKFFEDNHIELYNLRDDIGETKNLAAVQQRKRRELHSTLLAWLNETGARMPAPHKAGEKPAYLGKNAGTGDE